VERFGKSYQVKSIGMVKRTCESLFIRFTGVGKVWPILLAFENL
jgi:hypothetical protein